jgi:acyl dehydratase
MTRAKDESPTRRPGQEIRFDDVPGLLAAVSTELGPWGKEVVVSQAMIDAFADLTGDRQWIHVDVDRARRESPFCGPIAHGFLTLSLLPQLHPPSAIRIVGYGNATNYGSDGFRFLAPVLAGSAVHARARLVDAVAKAKGTLVTSETVVHVVGQDPPSLSYRSLVLYQPPRPPASGGA